MVTGSVAMKVHIETCDSNENNPDCVAARKLVAKMMDDDTTYEYAPDDEYALVWFAVSMVNCWVRVMRERDCKSGEVMF